MNRQRGITVPIVALSIAALFSFGALAIDLGVTLSQRTRLQMAADAAVLAGAESFVLNAPSAQPLAATNAANSVLAVESIMGTAPTATYTVDTVKRQIHVELNNTAPTFFAKVMGWKSVRVGVHATAEAFPFASQTFRAVPVYSANTDLDTQTSTDSFQTACSNNRTIFDANGNLTSYFKTQGYGRTLNIPWGYQSGNLVINSQILVFGNTSLPSASGTLCAVGDMLQNCGLPALACGQWVDLDSSWDKISPSQAKSAFDTLIGGPSTQDIFNAVGNYTTSTGKSDMSKSLVAVPVNNNCAVVNHPCAACVRQDGFLYLFITGTTASAGTTSGNLQTRIVGAAGCNTLTGPFASGIGPAVAVRLIQP